MGRISKLEVKETVDVLKELIKKQAKYKNIDRLKVLIFIKEKSFGTREELSDYIGVTRRTIENWLSAYKKVV